MVALWAFTDAGSRRGWRVRRMELRRLYGLCWRDLHLRRDSVALAGLECVRDQFRNLRPLPGARGRSTRRGYFMKAGRQQLLWRFFGSVVLSVATVGAAFLFSRWAGPLG